MRQCRAAPSPTRRVRRYNRRFVMRLTQVRRAFRLIGELRQLGADPQVWRPHLLRNLIRLIDADLIKSYRGVGYRMDVRQIVQ